MFLLFLYFLSVIILLPPFFLFSSYIFTASFCSACFFSSPRPPFFLPFFIFPLPPYSLLFLPINFLFFCLLFVFLRLSLLILLFVSSLAWHSSSQLSSSSVLSLPFYPFSLYVFILTFICTFKQRKGKVYKSNLNRRSWLVIGIYRDDKNRTIWRSKVLQYCVNNTVCMFTVRMILLQTYCYTVVVFTRLLPQSTDSCFVEGSVMLVMMYL